MTRTVGDRVEQLGHGGRVLCSGRIIAIVSTPGALIPVCQVEWHADSTRWPMAVTYGDLMGEQYRVTPRCPAARRIDQATAPNGI